MPYRRRAAPARGARVPSVTDWLPILVLMGPAAALLLAAVLLAIALRGRRVDDHPICRKCVCTFTLGARTPIGGELVAP